MSGPMGEIILYAKAPLTPEQYIRALDAEELRGVMGPLPVHLSAYVDATMVYVTTPGFLDKTLERRWADQLGVNPEGAAWLTPRMAREAWELTLAWGGK